MIYADYEARVATTEKGERYTFQDKEKMYRFVREALREEWKGRGRYGDKPNFFKGTTK